MYRQTEPFTTAAELLNPVYRDVKGVAVKVYETVAAINCSFKSYGGTEIVKNDVLTVVDTASVTTWYRPDITAASQIKLGAKVYEVIGEPEDIDQRHQYTKAKVRAVKGGA